MQKAVHKALVEVTSPEIVALALKEARRSPMRRFKNGAVIYDKITKKIISSGCSYDSDPGYQKVATIHAEMDAIRKTDKNGLLYWDCLVIALNKTGNATYSSCPCITCASLLSDCRVRNIIYHQQLNDGSWVVMREWPAGLLNRANEVNGKFARHQKIVAPI